MITKQHVLEKIGKQIAASSCNSNNKKNIFKDKKMLSISFSSLQGKINSSLLGHFLKCEY